MYSSCPYPGLLLLKTWLARDSNPIRYERKEDGERETGNEKEGERETSKGKGKRKNTRSETSPR